MTWFLFAFITALSESLKDVTGKLGLRNLDEFVVTSGMGLVASTLLLPLLFFIEIPELTLRFFLLLAAATLLFSWTLFLYFRAIRISDLSLTVPLIMYSPLFMLATSPLLLGEFPQPLGVAGVVLIVFGSYVLNISGRNVGFLAPFRALITGTGPRLMLFVAFVWSITANIDKLGLQESSALFWGICHTLSTTVICTVYTIVWRRPRPEVLKQSYHAVLALGTFQAIHVVCYMLTMNLALAVYGIAMKRTSVLFSVIFGRFLFKEYGLRQRLFGASIMLLGVIAILFSR